MLMPEMPVQPEPREIPPEKLFAILGRKVVEAELAREDAMRLYQELQAVMTKRESKTGDEL